MSVDKEVIQAMSYEECLAQWYIEIPPMVCFLPKGHREAQPFAYNGHEYRLGALADFYEIAPYNAASFEESLKKAIYVRQEEKREEERRRKSSLDAYGLKVKG